MKRQKEEAKRQREEAKHQWEGERAEAEAGRQRSLDHDEHNKKQRRTNHTSFIPTSSTMLSAAPVQSDPPIHP